MRTIRGLIWSLCLSILLLNWIILFQLHTQQANHVLLYPINFPKAKENPNVFSEKKAWNLVKNKKKIKLTLDGNAVLNHKKMEMLTYEVRKMKYTLDSNVAIIVGFNHETPFSEFLKIVSLCQDEMIYIYAPVKNAFIITGLYPVSQKQKPEKKIPMISM